MYICVYETQEVYAREQVRYEASGWLSQRANGIPRSISITREQVKIQGILGLLLRTSRTVQYAAI